jgi:hypothetical protein
MIKKILWLSKLALLLHAILRGGAVVARWAHNPKVAGSSPAPATKKPAYQLIGRLYFLDFSGKSLYLLFITIFNLINY